MLLFFNRPIGSELTIVYSLIFVVLILILVILFLDRRENKKKKNLFDNKFINTVKLPVVKLKKEEKEENLKAVEDIITPITNNNDFDLLSKDAPRGMEDVIEYEKEQELINDKNKEINDNYVDSDLEKTQAQLNVLEFKKQLQKAIINEREKIEKYEKEQEEEAIISYEELKKVKDQLYDKNEKIQYLKEGSEPISLDEVREKIKKINEIEMLDDDSYDNQNTTLHIENTNPSINTSGYDYNKKVNYQTTNDLNEIFSKLR